jgi:molybdopterin synthase catalytic subunit
MFADVARIKEATITLHDYHCIEQFPECGGVAVFMGCVRNHHLHKAVEKLHYTAYAPLAEKMIREIEQAVKEKYAASFVRVIHRVGFLAVGETAIIALAYAPHRREAFQACEEAVERVKHEVPVYKEEFFTDGTSQFVEGCCIRHDHHREHHA